MTLFLCSLDNVAGPGRFTPVSEENRRFYRGQNFSHRYSMYNARIELVFGERGVLVVSFKWRNTVFEILSFCRINLQFGIFSYALLRFSLLATPVHVVRKTLVKHRRIFQNTNLYDKNSKSQIQYFSI